MRRLARWLLYALPLLVSAALTLWALAQNPFAAPLADATQTQTRRALERALARQVTPGWLRAETAAALREADMDRLETLDLIATDRGMVPDPIQAARIAALRRDRAGVWHTARTCLGCMTDIAACPSVRLMTMCGVPFELTPAGDANALLRAGVAVWNDEPVDRLDATLAAIGLGATGAIVVSGGTSVTVKAGATVLRIGRRLGTLTPDFARLLGKLADVGLQPAQMVPFARGAVPLDRVVDTARLARLQGVAGDLARVAGNTSLGDAVLLLRHVDSAEDAARLARVSEIAGPRTRAMFDVLGKPRVFRALVRLSDLALTTAALILALAAQVLMTLAGWAGGRVLRPAARAAARRV